MTPEIVCGRLDWQWSPSSLPTCHWPNSPCNITKIQEYSGISSAFVPWEFGLTDSDWKCLDLNTQALLLPTTSYQWQLWKVAGGKSNNLAPTTHVGDAD